MDVFKKFSKKSVEIRPICVIRVPFYFLSCSVIFESNRRQETPLNSIELKAFFPYFILSGRRRGLL